MTTAVIISYILVERLWDELPFAVDAGVGALAGNLLLLLGDAARRRGRPTCVQGAWDGLKACRGEARKKLRDEQIWKREGI